MYSDDDDDSGSYTHPKINIHNYIIINCVNNILNVAPVFRFIIRSVSLLFFSLSLKWDISHSLHFFCHRKMIHVHIECVYCLVLYDISFRFPLSNVFFLISSYLKPQTKYSMLCLCSACFFFYFVVIIRTKINNCLPNWRISFCSVINVWHLHLQYIDTMRQMIQFMNYTHNRHSHELNWFELSVWHFHMAKQTSLSRWDKFCIVFGNILLMMKFLQKKEKNAFTDVNVK